MKKIFRMLCLFLISIIPFMKIKIFFFNLIPGVKIVKSTIGYLNLFYCKKIFINNTNISSLNYFNAKDLRINNSKMGNINFFNNFKKILIVKKSIVGSGNFILSNFINRSIFFSVTSQISNYCFLDLNGSIILRNNVVFGGHKTMVLKQNDGFAKTFFNKNIFIGSKSLIVSGLKIKCQNSIIGACSVITKDLIANGKYFSKKIKKII